MNEDEDWMEPVEAYPGPPFEAHMGGTCSVSGDYIGCGDTIRQTGEREYAHALCIRREAAPVVWE